MSEETIKNIVQKWIARNRLDSANQGISNAVYLELVKDLTSPAPSKPEGE